MLISHPYQISALSTLSRWQVHAPRLGSVWGCPSWKDAVRRDPSSCLRAAVLGMLNLTGAAKIEGNGSVQLAAWPESRVSSYVGTSA
jgi:hypothetical protein